VNEIIIIAAAAENNALGINNDLPWYLPADFKRFKALTTGHKIIMGRKTLESFPKALPNREHIAITRSKDYITKFPCTLVHSIEDAIELVKNDTKSFIIGGGEIYRQAMSFATKIELTRVHAEVEADTFFPEIDLNIWELAQEELQKKDDRHQYDFSYLTYVRRSN